MKPPLLLLHGALGSVAHFDELSAVLSDQYTIHRFNFYGHGDTPLPNHPLRMRDYATQLLTYIRTHELAPVAAFGYSMGGYAALLAELESPGTFSRIQTLATKFDWNPSSAAKESALLDAVKLQEKAPGFAAQLRQLHGDAGWEALLPAIAGLMSDLGDQAPLNTETFPCIHIPVRLMVGDHDNMVGIEETADVYRQLPQSSMTVLPDTKHPLEKVNKAVLIWEIRSFMTL
ncbi:alpha/beta fold hydrolase [Chitinophaga lutea]